MIDVLVIDDDRSVSTKHLGGPCSRWTPRRSSEQWPGSSHIARVRRFDLVVSDVQTPKGDGLALFRKVRHDSPCTAVVMMTASGNIPDAIRSLGAGAIDYLAKPFDPGEFVLSVVGPIAERRAFAKRYEEACAQFVA